jgi:hypothetical protein
LPGWKICHCIPTWFPHVQLEIKNHWSIKLFCMSLHSYMISSCSVRVKKNIHPSNYFVCCHSQQISKLPFHHLKSFPHALFSANLKKHLDHQDILNFNVLENQAK